MKKLRGIIVIVICAALCIGYYCYLSFGDLGKDDEPSEVAQLMGKDLDQSYPTTPREVVKFYNRILLCLYSEPVKEDEFESLSEQARKLMDTELLVENPQQAYMENLKSEVEAYTKDKKKIISTTISTSKEVEYKTIDSRECAYVESSYFIKGKNDSMRAGQTYILRKDEQGHWKILGFYKQG